MVTIVDYQARQGLEAPAYPAPRVDDSIGRNLQSVGGAISGLAERIDARTRQRENFSAQVNANLLQEQLNAELTKATREAPADGSGLHDGFMSGAVTPKVNAFLDTIKDPELRNRYAEQSKVWLETASNRAADEEYKIGNSYSKNTINQTWGSKANSISQSPGDVQGYIDEMGALIDSAPNLTAMDRLELKQNLKKNAAALVQEALSVQDPETYYFATGRGTDDERVSFLTKRLVPAVQMVENAPGDPNAVSSAGAIGLMQVTLGAAEEVAKATGDKAFLGLSREEQVTFLKNSQNNMAYGAAYLDLMVKRYKGDVEAALIAYNAGPGNADKWLAAGRDYAALPKRKETEPYVQKVMGNLGNAKLVSGAAQDGSKPGRRVVDGSFWSSRYVGHRQLHTDMDATFAGRLQAALTAAELATGQRAQITSLKRSNAEQKEAYANYLKTGGLAARPQGMVYTGKDGKKHVAPGSRHERGMAADIKRGPVLDWLHEHAAEYGLEFLKGAAFVKDPVHIQIAYGAKSTKYDGAVSGDSSPPLQTPAGQAGPLSAGAAQPPRSGFVSPIFADMDAGTLLKAQDQADKLRAVASRTEQAQAAADIVLQTIGEDFDAKTQAAAYDMVKGIGDAEVRKDATGLLDAEFKRRKQVSDQKAEEDYSASYDGVLKRTMAGDQAGALAAIRPTLDPAKRESLRQLALKGPVAEDDVETNVALTGMWVKDPKAFANVDLSTYLGKLTPGTIQKMRQWQQETAGQSSQDALSMRATINAGNAYIEKSLQEIGVDLSVTAGETDTRYANQIRSMATSELEKLHAKLGRAPLDSEIQDAIRPLFKKAQEPGMLWGTNAVTMKDVAAEYDGAGYDLLAAQKDLSDHGEPITVETLRAYKKALDTFKARQNQ